MYHDVTNRPQLDSFKVNIFSRWRGFLRSLISFISERFCSTKGDCKFYSTHFINGVQQNNSSVFLKFFQKHQISFHFFANGSQNYFSFDFYNIIKLSKLQVLQNLKPGQKKSEIIILGSDFSLIRFCLTLTGEILITSHSFIVCCSLFRAHVKSLFLSSLTNRSCLFSPVCVFHSLTRVMAE